MQIQLEKEKQTYDFEAMESQLDKALGQATRLQKEREGVQLEMDRMRDKYDKVQVSATDRPGCNTVRRPCSAMLTMLVFAATGADGAAAEGA